MSRAIQLSKIHALNWYGYRDTLPVKGNLVLAGVTGSGKSILMDLLMLVLVGPERARHHFNRSATGGKSDRTIKGYCLLDTKREENGQTQYFHDKGVTTYVAAEFTWPDGSRVETWGLRFEFRNTTENDGNCIPFFCPEPLERADFLTVAHDDGKSRTRTLAEFKAMIEQHGGRLFSSSREYLREMANPKHLNYNKEVLERLLPSAMSFTNLKSFDDFCRQFVLPGESVPVDDVISSFRDFESYERELRELRSQLEQLSRIRECAQTRDQATRDRDVATYLAAEHAWEQARVDVGIMRTRLDQLRADFAEDEARLIELDTLCADAQAGREHAATLLNESTEGRLYKKLAGETRELETEIEKLRNLASKIDVGLGQRLKAARKWMLDVAKAPVQPYADVSRMERALEFLDACERTETSNSLAHLASAADQLCKHLRERFRPDAEELRRLRTEKSDLESQIDALRRGLSPTPQPLLAALRNALPETSQEPQALRALCEVSDEEWRIAAETAFEEKFAVLVAPADFAMACEILHTIPVSELSRSGPQHLLESASLLNAKRKRLKNSLAEIFECTDPAVEAYIDARFGQVLRVTTTSAFERASSAILPNGTLKHDGVVTRPRPYDGHPFIGKNGLMRQLEIKLHRQADIEAALRRLEPMEREIERLIAARMAEIPDHSDISGELVRIERLPILQAQHDRAMADLQAISTDELAILEERVEELKARLNAWEREKNAILRKGAHKDIEQSERLLATRLDEEARRAEEFSRVKQRIDISAYLPRYHAWQEEMAAQFPPHDVRAREFSKAAEANKLAVVEATGNLRVAMLDFKKNFQPKFDDLPEDGTGTAQYERILSVIENANIPEYEKKSAAERTRWESLFRTQVLSRMQQAIKNVENILALLNHQLKRPIGHDRYKIDRKPNPEFRMYRELIDLNALHREDELFFARLNGEMRDALQAFLTTLVKNANSPDAARLLDYRQYFDYDLLVTDIRDPEARPVSVDKQSGKMSGGENQSPYFVAILASYLHAYNRHESRRKDPSLALVPIDEAFSKLSGERIQNCLQAMAELDLQGMFSMSSGNIPYAFSQCDELIVISRKEERRGNRTGVRNVPVILYRDSPEGRQWIEERGMTPESVPA